MIANVIQIESRTMINVDVSTNIQEKMCAKKVIFGILLHVVLKMVDMQKVLLTIQWLCAMKLKKQQNVFLRFLTKKVDL